VKKRKQKKITISDIAKEAKVSIATVSRYFSAPNIIKEKTRKRLKRVIDRYSFYPSISVFRSNKIKQKKISFLMNLKTPDQITMQIIKGLVRGCLIYDYVLSIYIEDSEREKHHVDNVIRNETDCLVVFSKLSKKYEKKMHDNNIDIVYLKEKKKQENLKDFKNYIMIFYNASKVNYYLMGMLAISIYKKSFDKQKKYKVLVNKEKIVEITN